MLKPLSNFDIINICKKLNIPLIDVVSKDELYQIPKQNGFYIVNMQNVDDGPGTHWVAMIKRPNISLYFDSYGFPPAISMIDFLRPSKIAYSSNDIQYLKSILCGYFVIAWLKYLQPFNDVKILLQKYDEFINLFSEDERKNDLILKKLLKLK